MTSATAALRFAWLSLLLCVLADSGCRMPPWRATVSPEPEAAPKRAAPAEGPSDVGHEALGGEPAVCDRIVSLRVRKSDRALAIHCSNGTVDAFGVALGRDEGAKRTAGDHRTPEGRYHIVLPARTSRFHRFIPIDYPSREDAERAFGRAMLSEREYAAILRAHESGSMPPQDTALGGGLGFHGEGERWAGDSEWIDWTFGCIALSDADIDFIEQRVVDGAEVVIDP